MDEHPMLALGGAVAAGAALAQPGDPVLRAIIAAAATLVTLWPSRIRLPAAAALACGYIAALAQGTWHPAPVIREHFERVACTVTGLMQTSAGMTSFTCGADDGRMFAVTTSSRPPDVGLHALVRGRIEPFDGPRNPGEPDLAAIERERGIDAQLASAQILRILPPAPRTPRIAIALMHAWALAQLRAHLPEPYPAILAGELWGDRASLSPELRSEFQETGTVHILVTAGLHLGVIAVLAMMLLKALRTPRWLACTLALAILWAYAIFSGAHLPSIRAAIMISFGLAAYAAGAAPRSWNAYGAALGVLALMRPQSIPSVSFALSFSCVGAILLLADHLEDALQCFAMPVRLREALVLTIATQVGTWPLTAAAFLLFAPYAVAANVLIVPVVGLTMALAGVQFALAPISGLAQAAANANSWLLAWIVSSASAIASLPYAAVPMTPPPVWLIVAYDAAVVFAAWIWNRNGRTLALCAVAAASLAIAFPAPRSEGRLTVTVLDVGQADAIVVQTPRNHTILVDAGGRLERGPLGGASAENVGERTVVPFLRRAGIRSIDALILSHPHGDHAGGAPVVLRAFPVGEFADSGQRYGGFAYHDALKTAQTGHVPLVFPRAGDAWHLDDGITLSFIGPSVPFIQSNNTINDNSIAFILQYKHFRMLFTGDAGAAAEQRFLNEGVDLRADVLKVGHHGSAYSSTPAFIAAVHPLCDRLRRPSQHVRASRAIDAANAEATRGRGLPDGQGRCGNDRNRWFFQGNQLVIGPPHYTIETLVHWPYYKGPARFAEERYP